MSVSVLKFRSSFFVFLISIGITVLFFSSCSKGYEVSFSNYYTESMDSVIVGHNAVVFVNVGTGAQTDYQKIGKGEHSVKMITHSKKVIYSRLSISGSGGGRRIIQIDAIEQISILED